MKRRVWWVGAIVVTLVISGWYIGARALGKKEVVVTAKPAEDYKHVETV
ncbi:hypothetical protein [Pontibacillus salipaludis]|uniref:Efflux transporter periplasmic adaptor subunit n=1 Tax=Pontibacillus salipaludis TaxID=1697394 RepID=A0ABQ1Q122_9BACI|nr:hypothetical protein [Pontibacillus salipaludis]GGD10060.1 hypothetical protein GCM10011389_16990 [Pontibacillus salipaludis]